MNIFSNVFNFLFLIFRLSFYNFQDTTPFNTNLSFHLLQLSTQKKNNISISPVELSSTGTWYLGW